jgi:hypothetical protein
VLLLRVFQFPINTKWLLPYIKTYGITYTDNTRYNNVYATRRIPLKHMVYHTLTIPDTIMYMPPGGSPSCGITYPDHTRYNNVYATRRIPFMWYNLP